MSCRAVPLPHLHKIFSYWEFSNSQHGPSFVKIEYSIISGVVFLVFRNETRRAVLPNEITCLDTVRALFVRSFTKSLTFDYLDSPYRRLYIFDEKRNVFYELDNVR